jgi:hypothetical protein
MEDCRIESSVAEEEEIWMIWVMLYPFSNEVTDPQNVSAPKPVK